MTNVGKKIASGDTISVSVGHGLDSRIGLEEQHPDLEQHDMQVDEVH
jgi:hypothetical protein